jgi:hypothetical protein
MPARGPARRKFDTPEVHGSRRGGEQRRTTRGGFGLNRMAELGHRSCRYIWTMARVMGVVVAVLLASGCRAPFSSPSSPTATSGPGSPAYSAEAGLCVDQTNRYRAMVGRRPLQRSTALDEYAAAAARTDGLAHIAHHHARTTNLGNGLSRAENAILWCVEIASCRSARRHQ